MRPHGRWTHELKNMERLVRINTTIIDKGKPDRFALQRVCFDLGAQYEYLIAGSWREGNPTQKPDGKRVVFDLDQFRAARDTYFAWENISKQKVDNPVKPEEIIKRIATARQSGAPLILFVPWGVKPEGKPFLEKTVMDNIQSIQRLLNARGINTQVLLMPADLYATEINRLDAEKVKKYFGFIEEQAVQRGFTVKPWSIIRTENIKQYMKRSKELSEEKLRSLLPPPVVDGALDAAKRRSGYFLREDVENAAFAYLRERVCEAEIIEIAYQPIKISAVAKNKDNGVDRDLPRLYLIPPDQQFPWLK